MVDAILHLLFGCRHTRITRPITPVRRRGDDKVRDTYVACLDCGRQLHYDLAAMRVGKAMSPSEASCHPDGVSFQA
jgi:hypothetical protein